MSVLYINPLKKQSKGQEKSSHTFMAAYTMPRITRCRPSSHSMQQGFSPTSHCLLILSQTSFKHNTEQCVFVYSSSERPFCCEAECLFSRKEQLQRLLLFLQNTMKHLHHNLCSVSVSFVFWTRQLFMFNTNANVGELKYRDYFIDVLNIEF